MQYSVASFIYDMKFFVAFDAGKKVVWLWKFINELGEALSVDGPILLY